MIDEKVLDLCPSEYSSGLFKQVDHVILVDAGVHAGDIDVGGGGFRAGEGGETPGGGGGGVSQLCLWHRVPFVQTVALPQIPQLHFAVRVTKTGQSVGVQPAKSSD